MSTTRTRLRMLRLASPVPVGGLPIDRMSTGQIAPRGGAPWGRTESRYACVSFGGETCAQTSAGLEFTCVREDLYLGIEQPFPFCRYPQNLLPGEGGLTGLGAGRLRTE